MPPETDWPVAFFDDDYLRIYRPKMTPERTGAEAAFIAGALDAPAGAELLDLGCGFGRHALALARLGYRVTGLDFNERYLGIAAADAAAAGVAVEWRQGDMRALPFAGAFDAVYSFFTSFGYYGDAENEQVLAGVARALRPGGRFLVDMVNRDRILAHPDLRTWAQREDGALFVEEVELDLRVSRVVSRQRLIDPKGGPQVTKEFSLRVYTCAELTALLARQGLRVTDVWGGAEREPYGPESRRLVMRSVKGA